MSAGQMSPDVAHAPRQAGQGQQGQVPRVADADDKADSSPPTPEAARALPPVLPLRAGHLTIAQLCDLYFQHYSGRDCALPQRLGWWRSQIGSLRLDELSDDHVHSGLDLLASGRARWYAGKDANDQPIYKAKRTPLSGSTLNRYTSALSSVITWAIRRRIAPKGFDHPVRRVELKSEGMPKTRFLSDDERERLLLACKASGWPRLYLVVLLALTTGARKGELQTLRWQDVDTARRVVHVGRSKNGDPKVLPLVSAVVEQLEAFKGAPGGLVFPSRLNALKPMEFTVHWHAAMKLAKVKTFRFHDLRHSCASYLVQQGATLVQVADLLGHRQISMSHRYAHLAATDRAALVDRVMGQLR